MKSAPARFLLVAVAGAFLAAGPAAAEGPPPQPSAVAMADTAAKFLATLTPAEKAKAQFPFDDANRHKWYFTPKQKDKQPTRIGVRFETFNSAQKDAALALLRSGLSKSGYDQAVTIMAMESLLLELEGPDGSMGRNPGWYFVSVFGEPSATGPWAWRVEGHHLSVNVTLDKGRVVSATPLMLGINPAEIRDGDRKGFRTMPEVEDPAKELIASLTDDQRKLARQVKQHTEIREGFADAAVGAPAGVPVSKLTAAQKATLMKLVEGYANRHPADIAIAETARVKGTDPDALYFSYCVLEDKPGQPYTYRIQGPTFVAEFLNEQKDSAGNPANHIHSVWRRLPADFTPAAP